MKIRKIELDGEIARVPLTQGYFAIIDSSDVDLVAQYNWSVRLKSANQYARRNVGKRELIQSKFVFMHRAIMEPPDGFFVDHINRNGLDNRRSNLRIVTSAQNSWNTDRREVHRRNPKRAVGVSAGPDGKWRANIMIEGVKCYLGEFESLSEAHEAYKLASVQMHGEYSPFK